jgi:hypothetical protein
MNDSDYSEAHGSKLQKCVHNSFLALCRVSLATLCRSWILAHSQYARHLLGDKKAVGLSAKLANTEKY